MASTLQNLYEKLQVLAKYGKFPPTDPDTELIKMTNEMLCTKFIAPRNLRKINSYTVLRLRIINS